MIAIGLTLMTPCNRGKFVQVARFAIALVWSGRSYAIGRRSRSGRRPDVERWPDVERPRSRMGATADAHSVLIESLLLA